MLLKPETCGRFLVLLALFAATGCSKRGPEDFRITILPTLRNRVSTLGFEPGDRIGLTIVRASGTYAENCPLTYDGTAFAGALTWYAERQEPSTLVACYPYFEAGMPAEFSVRTDQRAGCGTSDLLGAVKTEVLPAASPVGMVFNHLLTQLSIVVTNRTAHPVVGVILGGAVPVAEVDFRTQQVAAKAGVSAAEVQAFEVQAGLSYRVVLVPQCTDLAVTLVADDGALHTCTVPEAVLQSGYRYDLAIEWDDSGQSALLAGSIRDWIDGGTIVPGEPGNNDPGDDDDDDNNDDGVLHYAGERYRTQRIGGRLWMAENLRYRPANVALGTDIRYPEAGAASVAEKGLLYDREAVSTGALPAADLPMRGICPPGWHVPDRTELEALLSEDCGADFFCSSGCWIHTDKADKYGAYSYLMSATLSDDASQMMCLNIPSNPSSGMLALPVRYCVSLRCVQDE